MKWCGRLELYATRNRVQLTTELVFVEAIDCFCACLPAASGRMKLMFEIGKRLNFSQTEVYHYLFLPTNYN